jgi:RNA-binding protein
LETFDQGVAGGFKTRPAIWVPYPTKPRFSNAGSSALVPVQYNPGMDKKPTQSNSPAAKAGPEGLAPAPELSEKQRRHLRGLAHPLSPVIRLGKEGLTDAVAKETTRALFDHELIKVKAPGGDRDARDALFVTLAERTGSALVHRIGNVAVLYRPRPDLKRILIPD